MYWIRYATIFTPEVRLEGHALGIERGRIAAVAPEAAVPAGAEAFDGRGLSLVPGFIDLQLNGAFGDDFTVAPETIWQVAAGLGRYGVTSFLPTIITSPLEQVGKGQEVLAAGAPAGWRGAIPLGLHSEGPFLNQQKKGAHNPRHLRLPSRDAVAAWAPEHHVRLVTLAPELPGALEVVRTLVDRGVVVSAGHSMATYAEAEAGFAAGIRYGTHLFNAMPPLEHREPGLPGALLTNADLTVGIIPDGIHVHPSIVALAWTAKGARRLNIVTDAMAALGKPPGKYVLADQEVTVTAQDARLASGTLAGSVLAMDEAVRRLVAFTGAPLSEALATVTSTPADLLGIGRERGRIVVGACADLVLLTPALEVVATLVEGQLIFRRDPP